MEDIRRSALEAIDKFDRRQEGLAPLDDFESAMVQLEAHLTANQPAPCVDIAQKLFEVCRAFLFLFRVSELKISRIAQGLKSAIEQDNSTALLTLTRSLVEHLAALGFETEQLDRLSDELSGQTDKAKIEEKLQCASQVAQRLFYGTGPKSLGKIKQYHVNDFLKSLKRRVRDVENVYDALCEYVHPNYGSNFLVSTGKLGGGRLNPPASFHADTLVRVWVWVGMGLHQAEEFLMDGAVCLARFSTFIEVALGPTQQASKIFNIREISAEGNGSAKESAIVFKNARSPLEAIEMSHRYLEANGLTITGAREYGEVEDGFIYDVSPTNKGRVWFRIPMVKI